MVVTVVKEADQLAIMQTLLGVDFYSTFLLYIALARCI